MRTYIVGFIGAFAIALSVQTAAATPLPPSRTALQQLSTIVPAAHHCGKGQRWIPAGYAKHGKYRTGHCAPV
jgi:hypothetical protein